MLGYAGHAKVRCYPSQSEDQGIEVNATPIGQNHGVALEVDPDDFTLNCVEVRFVSSDSSGRIRNVVCVQACCRHLIQQGLEGVMIALVDESDLGIDRLETRGDR